MKLYVGGAYQGQDELARRENPGATLLTDFHETIRQAYLRGDDPKAFARALTAERPDAVVVTNEVGSLARVLTSFALSGLSMSRIESRPIPDTPFAYFFSADFEGEMDRRRLERAMEDAAPRMRDSRLLGVYPSAKRIS